MQTPFTGTLPHLRDPKDEEGGALVMTRKGGKPERLREGSAVGWECPGWGDQLSCVVWDHASPSTESSTSQKLPSPGQRGQLIS